ncbi:class I SAM-dependent methyltransferase [Polynucleobacter cosmopolitanus]|uniref:Methyltransferase type 11 n=1 Tax=Polynucleobacter cosmopolitanus TaxID=351345 RepID=A0A229FT60_9BURK|nr:class I SAM-dependent methyltransferase [Polynucleobacter cosmopolitanus]OXL15191.1 methyltransferase type 11 [Polynucleobacter cosmopolitanus]
MQDKNHPKYHGQSELINSDKYLPLYNKYIAKKMVCDAGIGGEILDFGAGIGSLSIEWINLTGITPDCIEIDPELREVLSQKGLPNYSGLESLNKTYDVIFTSNVLEHIQDDTSILKQLNAYLKVGGSLLIYVPAFQIIYSDFDLKVGHYRRYNKTNLAKKLIDAGFQLKSCEFIDCIGFFAWLWLKVTGDRSTPGISAKKMMIYDKYIFPLSNIFDRCLFKYLFGKNIYFVAIKK